jgi:hypothetical protein
MKCWMTVPVVLWALATVAQTGRVAPVTTLEFPVLLAQTIETGKTAVGTPVRARLTIGTLFNGVVVPQGAILSGLVEESVGKTEQAPARLKVHITQADWKDHTLPLNLYLSDQYRETPRNDLSNSGVKNPPLRPDNSLTWDGTQLRSNADMSDPANSKRIPDHLGKVGDRPGAVQCLAGIAKIKGVTAVQDGSGGMVLISDKGKLKLDRSTCYSFQVATKALDTGLHTAK